MRNTQFIGVLLSAVLLTACSTSPLGWGGTHEVRLANSKVISIVYDPIVRGEKKIYKVAEDHCAQFGKEAVPGGTVKRGMYPEATFRCE